jgi:phosphate transport system permease protein
MTDLANGSSGARGGSGHGERLGLARRYRRERRLKRLGIAAIVTAMGLLGILILDVVVKGHTAFVATELRLPVTFSPSLVDPAETGVPASLGRGDYGAVVRAAVFDLVGEPEERLERRRVLGVVSNGAPRTLREMVLQDPSLVGTSREVWVLASSNVDQLWKGNVDRDLPESRRIVDDATIALVDRLAAEDRVRTAFAWRLFTAADSRDAEQAGVWGAVVGSFWIIAVTAALAVPLGVASAVYLEEFAPKNRWTDLVEVNINNLAAVPSIVFGLLGLAVYINTMGLPRSAPLVGGLTITLMTLPTIVVATRAALRAVPPSIRWGALGVGASKVQVVTHHVLPLALPGILTGTIIGLAQALGESAPLLMIGMIAFVAQAPEGAMSPATALPVQIFLWAGSPERGYVERTAAAIIILLAFLLAMNALAIYLRKRFERTW